MQLKCVWLYYDIMDLYGDKGNMIALQKRCEQQGIDLILDKKTIGDSFDLTDYDLIFIGGGADKEQMAMMPDLLSRKNNLKEAMDAGSFVLLICGGYQFFGQYYKDANGNLLNGLGFYDYFTEASLEKKRCIGNIVIEANLDGIPMTLIGFENHGGQTRNVKNPLGLVKHGFGNNFEDGHEGFYDGRVLGTYIHGPILPKNSKLTDFIITKALQKRNPSFQFSDLKQIEIPFEKDARNAILKRYRLPLE